MLDTSSKVGGYATDSVAPAPAREIPSRMSIVSEELARYDQLLGHLVKRLDSVVNPGPARKEGPTEIGGITVLGSQLDAVYKRLKEQNDGLEFLIDSIQL